MKVGIYIAIGVVVLLIIYFVFIKKKSTDSSNTGTYVSNENVTQQQGQMGYTSSVAQIIQSLTGFSDSISGGSGFINTSGTNS